ncbi:hypothetical protein C8N36_103125 [Pelagimonas varians]|uniref:Uncharacterized protein n=1 Tax=Pelagimonas varians TaxID=696760 RepID=A0A238KHN7_9RHOB|nr:hypothetical protein C8N36_103125 [Pelagimonas varians]SMX41562.1 hypothetical protein PEV8663_02305 [Pelagimonas varians]
MTTMLPATPIQSSAPVSVFGTVSRSFKELKLAVYELGGTDL